MFNAAQELPPACIDERHDDPCRRATLDAIPRGSKGVVLGVSVENKTLCNKLLSMGIVNGTQIEVLAIAPLGDPMKIQALGYTLSLRRSEARHVEVALA